MLEYGSGCLGLDLIVVGVYLLLEIAKWVCIQCIFSNLLLLNFIVACLVFLAEFL